MPDFNKYYLLTGIDALFFKKTTFRFTDCLDLGAEDTNVKIWFTQRTPMLKENDVLLHKNHQVYISVISTAVGQTMTVSCMFYALEAFIAFNLSKEIISTLCGSQ